jgi:predicted nucleic acid-binding protein
MTDPVRVDANIIIRLLTDDPPDMAEKATALFERIARGDERVLVEDVIVAETIWTLTSFYKKTRSDIAVQLTTLLEHRNLSILVRHGSREISGDAPPRAGRFPASAG